VLTTEHKKGRPKGMENKGKIAKIWKYKTKCIQRSKKADFKTYYLITNHIAEGRNSISAESSGRTSQQ
jgi:hypothetical protein